jgi:hypothetical protein
MNSAKSYRLCFGILAVINLAALGVWAQPPRPKTTAQPPAQAQPVRPQNPAAAPAARQPGTNTTTQTRPRDAVQDAQTPQPPKGKRPELAESKHDKSDAFT